MATLLGVMSWGAGVVWNFQRRMSNFER